MNYYDILCVMILFGILRQLGIGTMANHVKPLDVAVGHFIPAGH